MKSSLVFHQGLRDQTWEIGLCSGVLCQEILHLQDEIGTKELERGLKLDVNTVCADLTNFGKVSKLKTLFLCESYK